jgi:hypothetical protein
VTVFSPICRITCHVPHGASAVLRKLLADLRPLMAFVQTSRSVQVRERKSRLIGVVSSKQEETLSDTFQLLVAPDRETGLLEHIITHANLGMADRGSVYAEHVELAELTDEHSGPGPSDAESESPSLLPESVDSTARVPILHDLMNIHCIVPRGLGSVVARSALELGTSVPSVAYASGSGGRDRLGLLRVAIPPEKEIVTVTTPAADAEGLARQIVDSSRLDRPGAGFVYLHPLSRGVVNVRLWIGAQRHAASINQLVAAVDSLWGGAEWRRRFVTDDQPAAASSGFLRDLTELTLICPEDRTHRLIMAAIDGGAGAATTSRITTILQPGAEHERQVGAVELTTLVVQPSHVEPVMEAMRATGSLADDSGAFYLIKAAVPVGYSYRRRG